MDNPSSPTTSTPTNAPGVTPFPTKAAPAPASASTPEAGAPAGSDAGAVPFVDGLLKRATRGAHDAVDSVAAKVSSAVGGIQDGVSTVGDTRDEWIDSAREAIRQHPFATIAGALLVGAAALSLLSSRDR